MKPEGNQEKERESVLTEDDKFSLKEELQKKVDEGNERLEKSFNSRKGGERIIRHADSFLGDCDSGASHRCTRTRHFL